MAGKVQVVVGGQFGSEGKGAIAAHLGRRNGSLAVVRVAGPNAGHSAVDDGGRKWALRQIPVVAVVNPFARLVIGAGSEIDPGVLLQEMADLKAGGHLSGGRLMVDDWATIINGDHKAEELGYTPIHGEGGLTRRIGSTGKGVGAARAARAMRKAQTARDLWGGVLEPPVMLRDTLGWLLRHLDEGGAVMIEGTQGYGLGLHAGFYPFCTSSDCRSVDFMAMAGIDPWHHVVDEVETWVVLRTYPIRVAGNSGPLYRETSWGALEALTLGHVKPEMTTVTKKVRRVGMWDPELARAAVQANGGRTVQVVLSFFDYWYPELAEAFDVSSLRTHHWDQIERVESEIGATVRMLGTGPNSVIDLRRERG